MGVSRSSSSSRGSARAVSWPAPCQPHPRRRSPPSPAPAYLELALETRRKLGHDHARLLSARDKGLPGGEEDAALLHQVGHVGPVDLEPRVVGVALLGAGHGGQLGGVLAALVVGHELPPVQVEARDEGSSLLDVVSVEAHAEQHRLDAGEAAAQVLGRGKGQAQDKVAVLVLLPLGKQPGRGRAVGLERQELVEGRLDVGGRLGRRPVAVRARLELGQDCGLVSSWPRGGVAARRHGPLNLSMAHSSNCSSVMSAVGASA